MCFHVVTDLGLAGAPGLDYSAGVINFAVLPSLSISGSWEAYSANATGWEPREPQSARAALERPGHPGQPPPDPQWQGLSLVRSITTDFWSWSEPEVRVCSTGLA